MVEERRTANPDSSPVIDEIWPCEEVARGREGIISFHRKPLLLRDLSEDRSGSGGGAVSTRELIEYIAKALVDHPEQVRVSEIEGEKTSVMELSVAKEDLGKVIGKQGRTAKAIRVILGAASAKLKKHSVLEIIE